MSEISVVLSVPRRGPWVSHGTTFGIEHCVSRPTTVLVQNLPPSSLLNHSFNQAWAAALNARDWRNATHFAMLHNDIAPDPGWLTVLLDELTSLDADVVSAVVPIKDERGLTSTAVYEGDPWCRRRLSLTEVNDLPDTFCGEDAGGKLLLNTGLWVCDLRREWCNDVCFHSAERIETGLDGKRRAEVIPEDWLFSHWLNERGAKLYATSKVRLRHIGETEFTNGEPWGAWTTDEQFAEAAA